MALLSSSFWLNFNQGEVVLRNPEVTLKSTGPTLNSSCSLPGDSCSRHPATGTFTHGVAASSETQARSFTPGHLQCPGGHCTHPFSFTLSQICLLLSIRVSYLTKHIDLFLGPPSASGPEFLQSSVYFATRVIFLITLFS